MKTNKNTLQGFKAFGLTLAAAALLATGSRGLAKTDGGDSGGGGMALVCRTPDKAIRSVELLDLWEARTIYDRPAVKSDASVEQQVAQGIQRLRYAYSYPYVISTADRVLKGPDALVYVLTDVANTFYEVPNVDNVNVKRLSGLQLKLTNDSLEDIAPSETGCAVEQVVNYKDSGMAGGGPLILVNQDIFKKMDNTNKAALLLHEALYASLREFGETNSLRVRRAIGYVMSGRSFKSVRTLLSVPRITCESESEMSSSPTVIHFVRNQNGSIQTLIERVGGMVSIGVDEDNSGVLSSIQRQYQGIMNGELAWCQSKSSPIDLENVYDIKPIGKGKLAVSITSSTSKFVMSKPDIVKCRLITK